MEQTRPPISSGLTPHLARLGRRLRLRDGWSLAQRSLWAAGAAMVAIQLAGRLWPIPHLALWTLVPLALWLAGTAAISALRPMPPSRVARRTDVELGLKERLSTAIALGAEAERPDSRPGEPSSSRPTFPASLVTLQRADALAAAQAIDTRRAFPLSWQRRPLWAAGLLIAAAIALALLPNQMDEVLAERAEVARVAQEEADRVERLAEELSNAEALSPEDREELLRRLAELAERLRENRGDREKALADLSRLEEALQREIEPHADARQAALDALAAQLQALADRTGDRQASAGEADPAAMDEALRALAEQLAASSAAERQALAGQLNQMAARAAQAGNPDLAQALADMAQAAGTGDAEAASRAARAASEAMRREQSELAGQSARGRALSQLQQSRESLAAAGTGRQTAGQGTSSQGQSSTGQQASGQGQGQGQGQQGGQGQGQGQGQGTGGQGTKADQLPPGTGQGQAGRPRGEGRSGEAGRLDQQVYVPLERRPTAGDEVTLPGQDTGQGETEVRERSDPLPGAAGEALVPYHEVYAEYRDAANEAMEQSYIPSGLKDVVREYFSRLEP